MIALLLFAAVIGIVMTVWNAVKSTTGVQREASLLNTTVSKLQGHYRNQGHFAGVAAQVVIDLGAVDRTQVSGNQILSIWRTPVAYAPTTLGAGANDAVAVTYTGVEQGDCSSFVNSVAGTFSRITVNGTAVKNQPAGVLNVDVTALAGACASAATGTVLLEAGLF
jgi:hypothetical protein